MQQGFFEVTPPELAQLGPELAVAVLREMLWAEVSNLGIPIPASDIPFAVTTPDGGVDAVVKATPKSAGNGLIFPPMTSYQVKAGDYSISATTAGKIEDLLMTPSAISDRVKAGALISGSSHTVGGISPRIRHCLDAGGTFVLMLFGNDGIDTEEEATEKAIQHFLGEIDPRYKDARIKVWRQSRICGLLRPFPAISLQIKNQPAFPLLGHERWSERVEMRQNYEVGKEQQAVIETIQTAVRDDSRGTIHIRLIGEPGIGKTRLVLEALRAADLAPLVLYADKASKVDGPAVAALNAAQHARIILVVDECGPEQRSELVSTFGSRGPSFKIVSIFQDEVESDGASEYRLLRMPLLPDSEIEAILKSYGVDPALSSGWAQLCDGSPRVAHVIGLNLRDHPTDPLKSDGVSEIWVRFLAGNAPPDSEEYRHRHLVLSSLALFKRFGWAPAVRDGGNQVYDLIVSKLDGGISHAQFCSIIDHMATRKVLQGDNFLYITPKALHIKLWIDWWAQHGANIDVNALIPQLNPAMRQWFGEMIEYAHAAPVSKNVVAQLLGPQGLYKDADWLKTKDGARFFFSLSLADPPRAMHLLERTIGKMGRDELLEFGEGRRDIIWALEGLALHADLFRPSAKILLSLAEAENETWSNNASGVFAGLFSLGYGELASTSLDPKHRLPVLTDALKQSELRAKLALNAFEIALGLHSTRWGSDQPFRMNERVARWLPKTNGDWFREYELYWRTLKDLLPELSPQLRIRAADVLLSKTRELLRMEYMHDLILETVDQIAAFPDYDKRKVISDIELILNYDAKGLPGSVVAKLEAIRDGLIGASFSSRLKRFAGMDLIQDQYDSDGNETNKTAKDIRELAVEALANPDEFKNELSWLVTPEAKNGYRFGYALSGLDPHSSAWQNIVDAWYLAGDAASDYFVGGYLRAIFERDESKWEALIRELARKDVNVKYLPALVWRSGISDSIATFLLELAKRGLVPPESLSAFSMGRAAAPISDRVFGEWLDFLIGVGKYSAAATALNLASMSLLGGRQLSAAQIEKTLTQPSLFVREGERANLMLAHYWFQLSKALIKIDAKYETVILKTLLENIGNTNAITASLGPDGERFLDELVSRHAVEAWRIVAEYIKPPMDTRGFVITRWLRGDMGFGGRNPGPMRHIPRDEIWSWIALDPEKRASYVATMAPRDFDPQTWKQSLVRELLVRFGDSQTVQSSIFSNFFTGGWSGPASGHYATQKAALLNMRNDEQDPNALRWLNDAIASTDGNIERAKIEEEARGF